MRQSFKYIAATGLLVFAAALILRGPKKNQSADIPAISSQISIIGDDRKSSIQATESDPSGINSPVQDNEGNSYKSASQSASNIRTNSEPAVIQKRDLASRSRNGTGAKVTSAGSNEPQIAASDVAPESPVEEPAPPLPAVRLANDVPLPAVILALHAEQNDQANTKPKPIKDAMKGIVDRFYEDLAKSAAEGEHASIDPDGTYVIEKGPAVDRARSRANELYRALFGDVAYNRMTMNAVLDAQLPPAE